MLYANLDSLRYGLDAQVDSSDNSFQAAVQLCLHLVYASRFRSVADQQAVGSIIEELMGGVFGNQGSPQSKDVSLTVVYSVPEVVKVGRMYM